MELHEDFWIFSVPVKEYMGGLFRDLEDPIETLKPEIGKVHIHASIFGNKSKPNKVRFELFVHIEFGILQGVLNAADLLLREVFYKIFISD